MYVAGMNDHLHTRESVGEVHLRTLRQNAVFKGVGPRRVNKDLATVVYDRIACVLASFTDIRSSEGQMFANTDRSVSGRGFHLEYWVFGFSHWLWGFNCRLRLLWEITGRYAPDGREIVVECVKEFPADQDL